MTDHVHRWNIATDPQDGVLPALCGCGASKTFPAATSYATGFGGTMTDNRDRQRRLYDGTFHRPYALASSAFVHD